MSLLPDERQTLDDIIATAFDTDGPVLRDVALVVIDELRRLEGGGVGWVSHVLDDWLVSGVLTEVRQWMRRQPAVTGQTKAGKPTEVPAFGGVRVLADDGKVQHVQLRLMGMTRAELLDHMKPKRKQRDTMSRNLSFYQSIADDMERCGHVLVGDALACMDVPEARTA